MNSRQSRKIATVIYMGLLALMAILAAGALWSLCASNAQAQTVISVSAGQSIQAAIDRAPKAQAVTIRVAPGIYREALTIAGRSAPITLEAAPGGAVTVRGSEVYRGWTRDGDVWHHAWRYKWSLGDDPWTANGLSLNNLTRRREVVWVGFSRDRPETLMRQVLSLAECRNQDATYFVDTGAGRIYLNPRGSVDPNTVTVEVAERGTLLRIDSPNTTVTGFRFEHAASPVRSRAVVVNANGATLNIDAWWNNWGGLHLNAVSNVTVRGSFNWNGWQGIGGTGSGKFHHITLDNVEASHNNTWRGCGKELGWPGGAWKDGSCVSWDAAGIKFLYAEDVQAKGTLRTANNDGPGFWLDWSNKRVTLDYLETYDNLGAGAFLEASHGPITIKRLLSYRNGFGASDGAGGEGGVAINNSRDITITGCIIADNNKGIFSANRGSTNVRRNGIQSGNWSFDRCIISASATGRRLVDVPFGAVSGTQVISGIKWGRVAFHHAQGAARALVYHNATAKQNVSLDVFRQRFPGGSIDTPAQVFQAGEGFRLVSGSPYRDWGLPVTGETPVPEPAGPSVAIIAPPRDAVVTPGEDVVIEADILKGLPPIETVRFYVDNVEIGAKNVPPWTYLWQPVREGTYVLRVTAMDEASQTDEDETTVTVAASPEEPEPEPEPEPPPDDGEPEPEPPPVAADVPFVQIGN